MAETSMPRPNWRLTAEFAQGEVVRLEAALAAVTADRDAQRVRADRAERKRSGMETAIKVAADMLAQEDYEGARATMHEAIRAAALASRTGGRADG